MFTNFMLKYHYIIFICYSIFLPWSDSHYFAWFDKMFAGDEFAVDHVAMLIKNWFMSVFYAPQVGANSHRLQFFRHIAIVGEVINFIRGFA